MSDVEWESLDARWEHISVDAKRASRQFEGGVDVDTVLADPHWNPESRQLSLDERVEIAVQLRNLKFFAETLPFEDLHAFVLPEADRRRGVGDYIEYSGPPPQLPPGVLISHGEATDTKGLSRMYYFDEANDPILYHHLPTTRGG
jgi:hypothetical protein